MSGFSCRMELEFSKWSSPIVILSTQSPNPISFWRSVHFSTELDELFSVRMPEKFNFDLLCVGVKIFRTFYKQKDNIDQIYNTLWHVKKMKRNRWYLFQYLTLFLFRSSNTVFFNIVTFLIDSSMLELSFHSQIMGLQIFEFLQNIWHVFSVMKFWTRTSTEKA